MAESAQLVLSDSAKTSQSPQSRKPCSGVAATLTKQQLNGVANERELADGTSAPVAEDSAMHVGTTTGPCAGVDVQPAQQASNSQLGSAVQCNGSQSNDIALAKQIESPLPASGLPDPVSSATTGKCSRASPQVAPNPSPPTKAASSLPPAAHASSPHLSPAQHAGAELSSAAGTQAVELDSAAAPVPKKRGRPSKQGRRQRRVSKRKASLPDACTVAGQPVVSAKPATLHEAALALPITEQQALPAHEDAQCRDTGVGMQVEANTNAAKQRDGAQQQPVFQRKGKRKAETLLKPAGQVAAKHAAQKQPSKHSKWLPSSEYSEGAEEQHMPGGKAQVKGVSQAVPSLAAPEAQRAQHAEQGKHGQQAQHEQLVTPTQCAKHTQRAEQNPISLQDLHQPQQLPFGGNAPQPVQDDEHLPNRPLHLLQHVPPHFCPVPMPVAAPVHHALDGHAVAACTGVIQQPLAGKPAVKEQQANRNLMLVASGLDKSMVDQLKRLCRRLHTKHGSTVNEHTTHVIVKASLNPVYKDTFHAWKACLLSN